MPADKRTPQRVSVLNILQLTPNMRRITFGADSFSSLSPDCEGSYVKLNIPHDDAICIRTYTIRRLRSPQNEMDVDFVMHDGFAPAANWAAQATVGDDITITGPGPGKMIDNSADWFFIAGDMTALPAISVNLEKLPSNARGYAVLEILTEDDKQSLDIPEGIDVHWVVNSTPGAEDSPLLETVKTLPMHNGRPSIWAACEFKTMRNLRAYFKKEQQISKHDLYVSSYWKAGISEDRHKRVKREDAETFDD